jgi:hypothetical protein
LTDPRTLASPQHERREGSVKRFIVAVTAGVVVFGAAWGMAASLGGINASQLGSDQADVSACDSNGVNVAWGAGWDPVDQRYEVSAVNVTGISSACHESIYELKLTDSSGAAVFEGVGYLNEANPLYFGSDLTVQVSPGVPASSVTGVHLLIH